MVNFNELIDFYSAGSVNDLNKSLGKLFNGASKGVKDIQAYFAAKQFKKKFNEGNPCTDKDRYNALMEALITFVANDTSNDAYFTNKDKYFEDLLTLFKSDDVFELFEDDFNKSFKGLVVRLNRFFNPKDREKDTVEELDNLSQHVRSYNPQFSENLKTADDVYFYQYTTESTDPYGDSEVMGIRLLKEGLSVLGLVLDSSTSMCNAMWILSGELGDEFTNDGFTKVDYECFMKHIDSETYELNRIHFVSLDTLKRDFMSSSFDTFASHAEMMSGQLNFYAGNYKFASDFNSVTGERLSNSVNGFPQSFADFAKNTFAVFLFNGSAGDVQIQSYWLMKGSLKDVMSDREDSFEWTTLSLEEFSSKMQDKGSIGTSMLH